MTKFENVELQMYVSRQNKTISGQACTIRTSEKSMSICWLDSCRLQAMYRQTAATLLVLRPWMKLFATASLKI